MNKFSFLNNKEYDFLRTNEHLGDNIILLGYGGSHAYGTNIPSSDVDIRGVAIRRPEDILTNQHFEQVTEEKTDTVVYALDKYVSLVSDCNPNTIELLGLRPGDYAHISELGQILLDNKSLFLSNKCIKTFGGYATSQLYRLKQKFVQTMTAEEYNDHIAKVITGMKEHLYKETGIDGIDIVSTENGLVANIREMSNVPVENMYAILSEINNVIKEYNKNSTRNNKAVQHEKIEKHGLHLLRLYMMLEDLLLRGEVVTYREKEHDLLMAIRNKEFTNNDGMLNKEFFDLVAMYENKIEKAKEKSVLPDKPNYKAINEFLFNANKNIVLASEEQRYEYEI